MVTLGFFDFAGSSDLPFLLPGEDQTQAMTSTKRREVSNLEALAEMNSLPQKGLLYFADHHNIDLCKSCIKLQGSKCESLFKQGSARDWCEKVARNSRVGLFSTGQKLEAWISGPKELLLSECSSACTRHSPTTNFFSTGYDRPYDKSDISE